MMKSVRRVVVWSGQMEPEPLELYAPCSIYRVVKSPSTGGCVCGLESQIIFHQNRQYMMFLLPLGYKMYLNFAQPLLEE